MEDRWVIQNVPSQPRDSSLLMEAPEPIAWLCQAWEPALFMSEEELQAWWTERPRTSSPGTLERRFHWGITSVTGGKSTGERREGAKE